MRLFFTLILLLFSVIPTIGNSPKGNDVSMHIYKISDFRSYDEPLKQAVAVADPGSTIIVDEDVFHRDNTYITITKALSIKGVSGATIYIDNKGNPQTGPFIYASGNNSFTLTIQDITIDGSRYGVNNDTEDPNRLFEVEGCDFILKNCVIQNMHYSGATGIGGQTEFISVYKYKYCEISNCIFQRIYSQIEGIFLKPKYNIYLNQSDREEGIKANNHRRDNNFALITNNKFLADTYWNERTQKIEFSDPNVFVSSWLGVFDGKCEFSNNYISGSYGSSVHLHVYDSKISGNEFGPICREGGINLNMDEAGYPYGFVPHNVSINNNIFRGAGVAIQCYCGKGLLIEGNTYMRPFKTSDSYTANNIFLSMITNGFSKERYIKNFIIKDNKISGIGSFIYYVQGKLKVDNVLIQNNIVRLADDYNKGMFVFYVASLSNISINNNIFSFGNYHQPYPSNPAGIANVQQLINIRWVPIGTKISNVMISDNTFTDDLNTAFYSLIGETGDRSYINMNIITLPDAENIKIKGNRIKTKRDDGMLTHLLLCKTGVYRPNVVFEKNDASIMAPPILSLTDYNGVEPAGEGQKISESAIEQVQKIVRHTTYYYKGSYYYAVKEGTTKAGEMKKNDDGYYCSGTAQFIKIEGKLANRIGKR